MKHLRSRSINTSRISGLFPLSYSKINTSITAIQSSYSLVHSSYEHVVPPSIDLARPFDFSLIDSLNLTKNSFGISFQNQPQICIMESPSNVTVHGDNTVPQLLSPGSDSGLEDYNSTSTSYDDLQTPARTIDEHISTLKSTEQGDFSNEEGIKALPRRRRPKSQRPLAIQLAQSLYPEMTEIAAIIKYDSLISLAKSVVRDKETDRLAPKRQLELLKIQGPWACQALDPVDLKGPAAIPMPVEVGKAEDFAPVFGFLAHESFKETYRSGYKPNFDFIKKNEEFTGNTLYLNSVGDSYTKMVALIFARR
jgi:hypothetical protein